MGRLAVMLGSNALGPGGEDDRRGGGRARRGDRAAPRRRRAYVLPHEIDHAANLRPLAEQGCDRVLAIGSVGSLQRRARRRQLRLPRRLHRPAPRPLDLRRRRARTRVPGFDPRWRGEVLARLGGERPAELRDGGVYWQAIGPALRDAGRDPPDRRPRRRGRDDDRLGVRRRRRARASPTPPSASSTTSPTGSAPARSTSPSSRPARAANAAAPARRPRRRCCRELGAVA